MPLDTVKVVGIPPETSEDQLATYFGQIGAIKKKRDKAAVFINREKMHGYIHYEDIGSAASAPKWFNGREFPDTGSGYTITVTVVPQYDKNRGGRGGDRGGRGGDRGGRGGDRGGRGRGGDRGGRGGGGGGRGGGEGGKPREGDWTCEG